MCTIVVLHGVHPDHPLAIIANRDELLDRASSGPRVLVERPRAIGGVDLAAGGSWMGANERGLFVGLTNQRTFDPADRSKRSRGEIVTRALASESAAEVESMLRTIDAREYNPFNLIFGTLGDVRVAYARSERAAIELERVAPGIAVLPNDRLSSLEFTTKIERAADRARAALPDLESELVHVLADHARPPVEAVALPPAGSRFPPEILRELQALCIHLPFYGTVSATAMLFGPDGLPERYLFAAGPPCVTPFSDVTPLLR